jgi:hypothetical protein
LAASLARCPDCRHGHGVILPGGTFYVTTSNVVVHATDVP